MLNYTELNEVADKEGFIVVYPNGIEKSWNDGRIAPKKPAKQEDVRFVSELIDYLADKYPVDKKRIFATGISNGGIFSIYLANQLSDKILAIAPVAASIPENLADNFTTKYPVSALFINGTDDKLIKYNGGPVISERSERGSIIAVEESIRKWVKINVCSEEVKTETIPDTDKKDNCHAIRYTYSGGKNNTEVVLIKIENGGHTWPGRKAYAPKILIGNTCQDFQAEEVIWEFFKNLN